MARKRTRSQAAAGSLPSRGDTFLMPLADGRLGACRVLRAASAHEDNFAGPDHLLVAATPWLGKEPPDLAEPRLRSVLVLTHHNWDHNPLLHWVSDRPPAAFTLLGVIEPSAAETEMSCYAFSSWEAFPFQVLLQWRWDHERAAVLAEDEQEERARELARQQAAAQVNTPRPELTYEQLRKQRLFKDWEEFVDEEAIKAARKVFRNVIDALVALGPEPPEPAVLDVLRHCIERFNELDEEYGFIATIEREDILECFYELVDVAGLEGYENLDQWRDW